MAAVTRRRTGWGEYLVTEHEVGREESLALIQGAEDGQFLCVDGEIGRRTRFRS